MHCRAQTLLLAGGLALLLSPLARPAGGPTRPDEQMLKNARVATDGPALLELFRKQTHMSADREKVRTLVRQLGDDLAKEAGFSLAHFCRFAFQLFLSASDCLGFVSCFSFPFSGLLPIQDVGFLIHSSGNIT